MTKPGKNNKDYDSTTHEPFNPEKSASVPEENPDRTKKKEKSDHTLHIDPNITSQPGNAKQNDGRDADDNSEPCEPEDNPELHDV